MLCDQGLATLSLCLGVLCGQALVDVRVLPAPAVALRLLCLLNRHRSHGVRIQLGGLPVGFPALSNRVCTILALAARCHAPPTSEIGWLVRIFQAHFPAPAGLCRQLRSGASSKSLVLLTKRRSFQFVLEFLGLRLSFPGTSAPARPADAVVAARSLHRGYPPCFSAHASAFERGLARRRDRRRSPGHRRRPSRYPGRTLGQLSEILKPGEPDPPTFAWPARSPTLSNNPGSGRVRHRASSKGWRFPLLAQRLEVFLRLFLTWSKKRGLHPRIPSDHPPGSHELPARGLRRPSPLSSPHAALWRRRP